jgi:acyl-coenzyme A thioesterase PaaI-like protein
MLPEIMAMPPKSRFSAEIMQAQAAFAGGATDYEQIRRMVDSVVPFNNHVGVRVTEVAHARAVAEVADRPEMLNHLGTVHAGAMFLAAEVACAGAFSGALAGRIAQVQSFVLRESKVSFLRPATGRIRAFGTVDEAVAATVLAETGDSRHEMTGKALLYDDQDTLVGKLDFDYVLWMKGA